MIRPASVRSITISDVAQLAGVSIKTVSRVLNREIGVVPETQALVRDAVAKLKYTPNPSARNLASVVSNTIGLAYSHISVDEDDRGGHQYALILQIGALEACRQHEFGLLPMPCDTRDENMVDALVARVRERRLGGLVIAAPLSNAPGLLDALREHGIPHVCINPNDLSQSTPYVAIDEHAATFEMTTHLIGKGHTRIGFIRGIRGSRVSEERYQGYSAAMTGQGLAIDPAWVQQGEFTFLSGRQCGERLLAQSPRVTAIFASNDDMAVGVMHAANARGIRIPDDISIAGFDDTELARFSWPPLTTIRQPLEQMAQTAVEQLIALVRPQRMGLKAHDPHVLFPCKLIVRASVADLRLA
ncbi:MAG: putative transcription regulator transcription regulator protein [Massilia sp.]|jgi:LacI family transcriptional regulator|nr:putative transcription regulator transcription regulator protein [Massilia sp.]MDB5950222.1 putative transcription regulator transcription regulator protein [Massilia sp.]